MAEEVVQETWLAVLRGLSTFEGRSSVQTWLYRILVNRARSVALREHQQVPLGPPERAVEASRFDRTGAWATPPVGWTDEVEDRLRAKQVNSFIHTAIDDLPEAQREVLVLRDVQGVSAAQVCDVLDITDGHQRVLLHRGRSRIRRLLEGEFGMVRT